MISSCIFYAICILLIQAVKDLGATITWGLQLWMAHVTLAPFLAFGRLSWIRNLLFVNPNDTNYHKWHLKKRAAVHHAAKTPELSPNRLRTCHGKGMWHIWFAMCQEPMYWHVSSIIMLCCICCVEPYTFKRCNFASDWSLGCLMGLGWPKPDCHFTKPA